MSWRFLLWFGRCVSLADLLCHEGLKYLDAPGPSVQHNEMRPRSSRKDHYDTSGTPKVTPSGD